MFAAIGVLSLLPVLAQRNLGGGAFAYGVLVSALGAGGVRGAALLPRARARLGVNRLVVLDTLTVAITAVVLARTTSLVVGAAVVTVFGVAWIGCLVTFNSTAQQIAPRWVRGRAVSVYLMVFMGATALGAPVWGVVTTSYGLTVGFSAVGVSVALTGLLALRWPISAVQDPAPDTSAFQPWNARPILARPAVGDAAAIVSHSYLLSDQAQAPALVELAGELREARLRDGAVRWSLLRDLAEPLRWRESYVVGSIDDHLRQHERQAPEVLALERRLLELLASRGGVTVTHELVEGRRPARLLTPGELRSVKSAPAQKTESPPLDG